MPGVRSTSSSCRRRSQSLKERLTKRGAGCTRRDRIAAGVDPARQRDDRSRCAPRGDRAKTSREPAEPRSRDPARRSRARRASRRADAARARCRRRDRGPSVRHARDHARSAARRRRAARPSSSASAARQRALPARSSRENVRGQRRDRSRDPTRVVSMPLTMPTQALDVAAQEAVERLAELRRQDLVRVARAHRRDDVGERHAALEQATPDRRTRACWT